MKLEIKHLAPYLEHSLKCVDLKGEPDSNIFTLESINIHGVVSDNDGNFDIEFKDIKPILRPLFDLTKEIEYNGEKFIPYHKLGNRPNLLDYRIDEIDFNRLPYDLIQILHSWHFDTQGLIEAGLAIDKNTIK